MIFFFNITFHLPSNGIRISVLNGASEIQGRYRTYLGRVPVPVSAGTGMLPVPVRDPDLN